MKIVALVGSGRKRGNTDFLTEKILEYFVERIDNKVNCQKIYLSDKVIKSCIGCRLCFEKGEEYCPMEDDLISIFNTISIADGLIIGSPVYVEDISGMIKNWIDRMAFNSHRPAFSGKPALIFTTSGVGSTGHALKTMKTALNTWGFNVIAQAKFHGDVKNFGQYEKDIIKISKSLYEAIRDVDSYMPSFLSMLFFKVQQSYWQNRNDNSYDLLYWEKKGWLEKDCCYYTEIKKMGIKTKMARAAGGIISKFFIR